jgi:hypothetical protein
MSAPKCVSRQPKMRIPMALLEKVVIRRIGVGTDMNEGTKHGVGFFLFLY